MGRKEDLEQHIRKEYKLLREFEEEYRLASDPRYLEQYSAGIKRQKEALKKWGDEYRALYERQKFSVPQDISGILNSDAFPAPKPSVVRWAAIAIAALVIIVSGIFLVNAAQPMPSATSTATKSPAPSATTALSPTTAPPVIPSRTLAETVTADDTPTDTPTLQGSIDAQTPTEPIVVGTSAPIIPDLATGQFIVNQSIETNVSGLIVNAKSIEILPNGTMRWHLDFWNKTNSNQGVRSMPNSYVTDEQGSRYAFIAGFNERIQPNVRIDVKVDFEAPKAGAGSLTLYLYNGYIGLDFSRPSLAVLVTLPSETAEQSTSTPSDTAGISINQPIETNVSGLIVNAKSIEILPNGTMRWHLDFWNKTNSNQGVRSMPDSYVTDEQGSRYAFIVGFDERIQPNVRIDVKVDFEAPKAGTSSLTLYLYNGYIGLDFSRPSLTVPITLP